MGRRTAIRAFALKHKIHEMHQEGLNASEIARALGMSAATVYDYLDGIIGSPTPSDQIDKRKVIALAAAGHTTFAIAKSLKTSRYTIAQILIESSLTNTENT